MLRKTAAMFCFTFLLACSAHTQAPVTLTIDAASREFAIPADFSGLGFETKSAVANQYGVSGNFFTPENTQLITLFQNMGIKNIRVGGGTVDGSGRNERCVTPTPTEKDIDHLFEFARAAGINVIYSVRLLNVDACANPHLAADDAAIAQYVWSKYRADLASFSIGNEPDVRQFHTYPGHPSDSAIVETTPGISGSAYPSYFADWRRVADVILKSVPDAKFSGPDTAVSDTSSFTPNPSSGVSWTEQFATDLKSSGILAEALQHHYVWGSPGNSTAQEAIDDMLSSAWDNGTTKANQPAMNGGTAVFHPYPFVYDRVLSSLVTMGVPYRMTEANDCLYGVVGASNGYAAALWALDYMHWWAAHHMAGVNFHNNPWIPTDTVVPDPNPCPASGCGNYRITAKGYGIKAFDVGGHGYVMPVAVSNPAGINLTAYAVGTDQDLYVTILNRTHSTTHDVTDATVTIDAKGFRPANAATMLLTGGEPGQAATMTATLGGASITNNARWLGKWSPLGRVENGRVTVTVVSTTAVIVKIHAAGAYSGPIQMDQDGELELFRSASGGKIVHAREGAVSSGWNRAAWAELPGEISFQGTPAVVRNGDNTLEVFATSADGRVYCSRQLSPDGEWSGWSALGSDRIAHLAAAQNADGSASVFGIGTNGDLWTDSESAPGVGGTGWRDLGGKRVEPGYAVAQNLSGRLEVFGVDKRGTVWSCAQTDSGDWSGWSSLAGRVAAQQLGAGKNLDGRLELFAIGLDGHLEHLSQRSPDGKWGEWSVIGEMKVAPGFVVGQHADGRLVVFAMNARPKRDAGKTVSLAAKKAQSVWGVAQKEPGGPYGTWNDVRGAESGVAIEKLVAAGNDRDDRVQLFGLGEDNGMWVSRQSEPVAGHTSFTGWTTVSHETSTKR